MAAVRASLVLVMQLARARLEAVSGRGLAARLMTDFQRAPEIFTDSLAAT